MQDRHLCWTPYFFLRSALPPTLFLESPLFDGDNHRKSIFITTENHQEGEAFMVAPYFFP